MGIKSIFDGLYVDQLFQKDERGRTVFYPHGLMGRGYRLPADREARVRRSMRRLLLVALVLGISFGLLVLRIMHTPGEVPPAIWLVGGGAFVLLLGLVAHLQARLALGLEPVSGPFLDLCDDLHGEQRVSAEFEEVVVAPDLRALQHDRAVGRLADRTRGRCAVDLHAQLVHPLPERRQRADGGGHDVVAQATAVDAEDTRAQPDGQPVFCQ